MRAHYLQHVPFEGLGSIATWLGSAEYEIGHTRLFESAELPALDELDLLVVMGGPMSVNDEAAYPWLADEKRFIGRAIAADKPVLGVCLGAQLIASSLGARVYPNRHKEIGWHPVQGIPLSDASGFQFPAMLDVFHWHGETFELPPGAVHLARSAGCEHQAFQLGKSVIGLQFHLETTPQSAKALVQNCRDELVASQYVQSEEEILAAGPDRYSAINAVMQRVLAFLHPNIG
jgi:GMP synthase-like glutamine amidotransferase